MVLKRTYGTKRSVVSSAATTIFGTNRSLPKESKGEPLVDITSAIGNLVLEDEGPKVEENEEEKEPRKNEEEEENEEGIEEENEDEQKTEGEEDGYGEEDDELAPLRRAYPYPTSTWSGIIPALAEVTKIAEASFSQVFRITTPAGTSIIKVIHLRLKADPASLEEETAIDVESVVSEIQIMDALTEVPGYVTFKDAHLVRGRPSSEIITAYNDHLPQLKDGSYFPEPAAYSDESTFLVIELGDAGCVLEDFKLTDIRMVWDILLGLIMALCRAEISNEFEHRDLHENNICVATKREPKNRADAKNVQFGYSGLEITVIDYGLSRATLDDGKIIFNDLEQDLGLFHGTSTMQFDIYRRMRTYLFTGERTMMPKEKHNEKSRSLNNGHTWREFIPYTNVLWINYIMQYLIKTYRTANPKSKNLAAFEKETKRLSQRLNVRTKVKNGAFTSAQDVLEFVALTGWVTDEQLSNHGVESSLLSEEFSVLWSGENS